MMQPNEYSGGGMEISGRWVNTRTGNIINVINSVIDGDRMVIISDVGHIDMETFSRDYVQASDEIYDEKGKVIGKEVYKAPVKSTKPKSKPIDLSKEFDLIDTIPAPELSPEPVKNLEKSVNPIPNNVITNDVLIKKVFDKIDNVPEIVVDIKWNNIPKEQLKMLIEFLDVKYEDIGKYIFNNYFNNDNILLKIQDFLKREL